MLATLSYIENKQRKEQILPYYEIESFLQAMYEKEKLSRDFDFSCLESQYNYFSPYLDYFLLEKEGKIDSFLMDENTSIYSQNHQLFYYSKKYSKLHHNNHIISFLQADDKSIHLNQQPKDQDPGILLADSTCLSYDIIQQHGLLMDFYLHYLLMNHKDIATHYDIWRQKEYDNRTHPFDQTGTYLSTYLAVIRFVYFDSFLYYTQNPAIQTKQQSVYLNQIENKSVCYSFHVNQEEKLIAKKFMKSFF